MTPALPGVLRIEAQVQQRIHVRIRLHNDVAAASAIAAARTPTGHVLLAPKRKTAVAAIAGLHANANFIDKHVCFL